RDEGKQVGVVRAVVAKAEHRTPHHDHRGQDAAEPVENVADPRQQLPFRHVVGPQTEKPMQLESRAASALLTLERDPEKQAPDFGRDRAPAFGNAWTACAAARSNNSSPRDCPYVTHAGAGRWDRPVAPTASTGGGSNNQLPAQVYLSDCRTPKYN